MTWINAFMWEPARYTEAQAATLAQLLEVAADDPAIGRVADAVGWYVGEAANEDARDGRAEVADELDGIMRLIRRGEPAPAPSLAARNACARYLPTAEDIIAFRAFNRDQDAVRWAERRLPRLIQQLRKPGRDPESARRSLAVKLITVWKQHRTDAAPRFSYNTDGSTRSGDFYQFVTTACAPVVGTASVAVTHSLAQIVVAMSKAIEADERGP
jgi:hypothetical protein